MKSTLERARQLIREIPDYPQPGIRFQDLTPLMADGRAFETVINSLQSLANEADFIAGIEARGFIFAAALAQSLGLGFIPIRKAGKLPSLTFEEGYGLEYGDDVLQIHQDALGDGAKVLLIDDVLATGGTLAAGAKLLERLGAKVIGSAVIIEISELSGRQNFHNSFPSVRLGSLFAL